MWKTLLTASLAAACVLSANQVKIHGYITDLESPKSFTIDDYKIKTGDHLDFQLDQGDYPHTTFRPEDLRVGNEIEVQGDFNDSTHELQAVSIKVFINDNVWLKRSAVIEGTAALQRSGNSWSGSFHADGQTIRVNPETRVVAKEWQTTQLSPGMSIVYEGFKNREGSINATRLEIFASVTGRGMQKIERDNAAKLNSDGEISIRGVKYKLTPDAEAQSYVQRVGSKLVPLYYQNELSGGAARKEPFQFYLVDNEDFNAHAFPNGIVLVNSGVFRVLNNEAQLAAVLGHEIAHATQDHSYREMQYEKKKGSSEMAEKGYAGAKGDPIKAGYSRVLENQADRIGLEYMIAAGYDPREAAEVWKQVARTAGRSTSFWDTSDDVITRRSYLLSELHSKYSSVDYTSYTRNREEFDNMAARFGNASKAQHAPDAQVAVLTDPPVKRPGYRPPSPPMPPVQEKRYGANAVAITSAPVGAEVLLNGTLVGKTPMMLSTGNPGIPYIITIRCAGYQSWTGQMVSVPGRTNLPVELFSLQ